MHLRTFLLGTFLCASACTTQRTEVMLGIVTDLMQPGQIDEIKLDLYHGGVISYSIGDYCLLGGTCTLNMPTMTAALPASLGVDADGAAQGVEAFLTGYKNNQVIVTRHAFFSMPAEQTLFYRMALEERCVQNTQCGTAPQGSMETCVEGVCRSAMFDSSTFPAYTANEELKVQCASGATFIDSANATLPMQGTGCKPNETCVEGTCYKPGP
jgi:hypothetical protein